MSQLKVIRTQLAKLVMSVNAPLPINCRTLPDGTILDRDTGERMYPSELNKRYLIAILSSFEAPVPPPLPTKNEQATP